MNYTLCTHTTLSLFRSILHVIYIAASLDRLQLHLRASTSTDVIVSASFKITQARARRSQCHAVSSSGDSCRSELLLKTETMLRQGVPSDSDLYRMERQHDSRARASRSSVRSTESLLALLFLFDAAIHAHNQLQTFVKCHTTGKFEKYIASRLVLN